MSKAKHTADLDMGGNRLSDAGFEMLSASPTPTFESRIYYNSNTKRIYYHNGTEWAELSVVTSTVFSATVSAGGNGEYTITHNLSGSVIVSTKVKSTGNRVETNVKHVDANTIMLKTNIPLVSDLVVTCVYSGAYIT